MRHLTVDEIINFVSLTEMSEDAVQTCAAVNGHIRKCGQCLRRVQAFQNIYDAFTQMETGENFAQFVHRATAQAAAADKTYPEPMATYDNDR